MSPTSADIQRLRRLVNEPTTTVYSDEALSEIIERNALTDHAGREPWVPSPDETSFVLNELWLPTYDLNAAAADIWEEKAAAVGHQHDYSADGGSFSVSQKYQQFMNLARHYRSRRRVRLVRPLGSSSSLGDTE